jgi:nicotinamide riboside transporter PnuC
LIFGFFWNRIGTEQNKEVQIGMKSLKQWIFILIALIMIGAVAVVIVLNKDEKKSKGITISDLPGQSL